VVPSAGLDIVQERKFLAPAGNQTLGCPACTLVNVAPQMYVSV
jgi:hypothetical protein